jgi:N-acetylmuramoyl-L-alanine amidase
LARSREHVITRGDTLSAIAQRYDISLHTLRVANGLTSDHLEVGEVLRIPRGSDS